MKKGELFHRWGLYCLHSWHCAPGASRWSFPEVFTGCIVVRNSWFRQFLWMYPYSPHCQHVTTCCLLWHKSLLSLDLVSCSLSEFSLNSNFCNNYVLFRTADARGSALQLPVYTATLSCGKFHLCIFCYPNYRGVAVTYSLVWRCGAVAMLEYNYNTLGICSAWLSKIICLRYVFTSLFLPHSVHTFRKSTCSISLFFEVPHRRSNSLVLQHGVFFPYFPVLFHEYS